VDEKTWQIVLSGIGGQGLILAGVMLAKAGVLEDKNALQTQTYGIQTRGGFSQAEVIISEGMIYFPKCDQPNLVLALSQAGYDRYRGKLSEQCIVLYDQDVVKAANRDKDIGYPFQAKAVELGNEKVINSLALGAVLRMCPAISTDTMAKVMADELPPKVVALNIRAMELGYAEFSKRFNE